MTPVAHVAWRRRAALLLVLVLAGVSAGLLLPRPAITRISSPETCIEPTRRMTMYAQELPRVDGKVRLGYGLTPDTASIPGPAIEMFEGECLAITLVNDVSEETLAELRDDPFLGSRDPSMPLGVSLHVHGVKYTTDSDGTMHTNSYVPPGESRTYIWYAAPRVTVADRLVSLGTAGYWWYHDHVAGTDHGTGGVSSGLFGGVVVRRPGDLRPDRTYTVVMGPNATINLSHYPETDCADPLDPQPSNRCFIAVKGERVEFIVVGVGDDFHTFHLHGHIWANNRTGILRSHLDETRLIDNRTVGPADTFGFQIIAGEEVGAGSWMLHCHVQSHSDRGMMTFLHVLNADQPVPALPAPVARTHLHDVER